MKRLLILAVLGIALLVGSAATQDMVADTPHNLSTSGPGAIRSGTESEICIFCHAPHNASPAAPLWNRDDPGHTYTTYTSTTMKVAPGQPSGATRLCLSCHDGTIALGRVLSRPADIPVTGGPTMPPGRSNLGLDLSDDHPISFRYADSASQSGGELVTVPDLGGRSPLDPQGEVQCTSCHDPHDNTFGRFLRTDPARGGLCLACHQPQGWGQASHALSSRSWDGPTGGPRDPSFTTVADYACQSCHSSHEAPGKSRLLQSDVEEDVCYACHDGTTAQSDISTEMAKWRAHDPSQTKGDHDPAEIPDGSRTHVECADCHDPHEANSTAAGNLSGPLRGVSGYNASGPLAVASEEYEVCYKCHADVTDSNINRLQRLVDQASVMERFDKGNPSYHPLEAAGRNADVPSLKPPLTPSSLVKCSDCHGNDDANGPKGVHGSRWDFLLKLRYDTADPSPESFTTYELCYSCHERNSILGNDSFKEHKKHIEGEDTSCSVCHAPHGVDASAGGDATGNSHLINFRTDIVSPNRDGVLEFRDLGRFSGTCSLKCHGEDHRDEKY